MPDTTVHVTPRGDLIEHDTTTDYGCPCGPTSEPARRDEDGSIHWVMVHHSLDGRETEEETR